MPDNLATEQTTFQFKGGLYTLTTLQLFSNNVALFSTQLKNKIQQAPNFFNQAPVVIDVKQLNCASNDFALLDIIECIKQHNLIPVGIKNASAAQKVIAQQYNLATIDGTENKINSKKHQLNLHNTNNNVSHTTKFIAEPVRSGQQICAPNSDLIIMATVSPGAEIIAAGNIHVYGALKGRALAGIHNNPQAKIFCQYLEAELVSIAGQYKISEDIEQQTWQVPAVISIEQEQLSIAKL